MNPRLNLVPPVVLSALLSALLAGCGGGGGSSSTAPTISSLSIRMLDDPAAALRYRGTALVTASGSGLAATALDFNGSACLWGSTPPGVVNSDTAVHAQCTLVAVGAQQVTVAPQGGAVAQSAAFDVPQPQVTLAITDGAQGSLVLTLDPTRAPITVDNFLRYVGEGFYDGTAFHRHAPGFVLQGGGFAAPLGSSGLPQPKPTHDPIALEVGRGLSNLRYTVAMARTSLPDSATSQFFINLADNVSLDTNGGGYAVFGSISTGTDVVAAMQAASCVETLWSLRGECLPVPNLVISTARQTR